MPESYILTRTLREDPAGGLYQATRQRDGARVLIEALRAEPPEPREAERLRNEYESLRRLEGSHLLKPYELERQKSQLRLILEGFDGEPLASQFDRPLEVDRFLDIALGLTAALSDIHRQGVVHRDLRPANILVQSSSGALKLIGFGIAARTGPVPAVATSLNLIEGSLAYMSPEQAGHTNQGVDHRSDLYSLGVIFYELLTGRLPFQAADPLEWVHCHIAQPPKPPAQIVPTIPPGLSAIVLKLLAKQPEERYQSARGLLSDLECCRAKWAAEGTVAPFPLGQQDASDRLLISRRLYGREGQVASLVESFERMRATGKAELTLVSGYSGIGKSSLIQELRRPAAAARGYFVAGKFDQYQRDIPYATLVQAFQDLLQQILTESNERIHAWRAALLEALGANGQIVVDLVPQLELIIGPQPPVPKLLPSEAQNRFHRTFHRFIGVSAQREHPLVVFLDDLQWLDPASLKLIEFLMACPEPKALLLVGAYRDNEVSPSHPLMHILDEVRRSNVPLHELVLGPLSPAHLTRLVADTLRRPVEAAAPLAQLIYEKTAGNPFFAIQFLTALYQERLLVFSRCDAKWQWDLAAIRRQDFTDNVVELMLEKVKRLPATTQRAIMLGACVGNAVDAHVLALLNDCTQEQLEGDLREAMDDGLVSRTDGRYKFLHDRVQEAAYALLAPALQAAQHLQIGHLLLAHTPEELQAERIFEIVSQLNRGAPLINSAAERRGLADLNLLAGRRAKAATAFASAIKYLSMGTSMLDPADWESNHDLAFALFVELAECEYLIGSFKRSGELLTLALEKARSLIERAWVYRLRQRLFQLSGRFHEALETALTALRLFGVSLPETDEGVWAATEAEIGRVPGNLRGRPIADLAEVPLSEDAEVRAFIGLLAEAMPLIYVVRPMLWPPITAKGVNICLQRGHAEESPFVYSCYSMVLVGVCRDIPSAFQFSEMAIKLNERFPAAAAWRGKLLFHHAALISIWSRPFAANLTLLEQAFQACLDCGDLVHGAYLTYNAIWVHLESGDPLDQVVELARRYSAFARQSHNDIVENVVQLEEHFALSLQGKTRSATSFSSAEFDEAGCVAAIERAGFGLGIAYYRIMKQIAAFCAGRFDEALEWADRAAPMLLHVSSMANEATHHFFRALTLAALHGQVSGQRQQEIRESLEKPVGSLKLWAEHCPDNFAHRYALVCAETARIEGRDLEAMRLYDRALHSARENGIVHGEALAFELASYFYSSRGFVRIAEAYLREARACYARWGAGGKVEQLDRQHPFLVEASTLTPTSIFSARTQQLDLLSVTKASQAISREIIQPNLQEKLMRLVLEHAGAQRGALLLVDGARLAIHAWAEMEGGKTKVEIVPALTIDCTALPMTLLNYVRRSGEAVVLADAALEGRYSMDEYIARRKPRSVMGMPITRQGALLGMLYLENNVVAGAFNSNKLAVLELLAAQAAVSLETARLYADLRQENAERQRAEEEVRQLNRELEHRVLDRTAALEATNKDLDAFAHSVSHDLRSPLGRIDGFLGLLRKRSRTVPDEQSLRYMDAIANSAKRMESLIADLLSFSRMGRAALSKQAVDLGGLVQDVVRETEPETRGRAIRWRIAELPVVTGDRSMLRIVLVNLIANALKFTRQRAPAEIEVGLTCRASEVVVYVRDNGVGFDARHAEKLFGTFQRLHRQEEFEGTGIGLANVRRIIDRHGGRVWAEGEVNRGATFYFSLPHAGRGQSLDPAPLRPEPG